MINNIYIFNVKKKKRKKKISISSTWNIKEKTPVYSSSADSYQLSVATGNAEVLLAFSLLSKHCIAHTISFLAFPSLPEVVFSMSNMSQNEGRIICRLSQSNASVLSVKWNLVNGSLWPDNVSILQQVPTFHPHPKLCPGSLTASGLRGAEM